VAFFTLGGMQSGLGGIWYGFAGVLIGTFSIIIAIAFTVVGMLHMRRSFRVVSLDNEYTRQDKVDNEYALQN